MKIEGVEAVVAALRARAAKYMTGPRASVSVGYPQEYALHVHEDLEAYHRVGQAKFLEQPAREMKDELARSIQDDIRSGLTMAQALVRAGLKLQAASQKLCPVDTGALRASAYTRLDEGS